MKNTSHDREDPRWGAEGREPRAQAIFATLLKVAGARFERGVWLDIGCGSGGIAAAIAPKVRQMIGVDPEPWPRWEDDGRRAGAVFHVGSYEDLPILLGDATVDVAICNQVYEHVPSAETLVRSIARVLKPGGVCYFAGPNLLWPIEPHVYWPFVHWLPRGFALKLMAFLGSSRTSDLDAWSLDLWRLRGLFRRAGLDCQSVIAERLQVEAEMAPARRTLAWAARAPHFVFRWLLPLSPGFVFLLRKPEALP